MEPGAKNKKVVQTKKVTKRFLKVMRLAIAERWNNVTNISEFTQLIGEYYQNISKMEAGTRYPTLEVVCITCLKFDISPAWLLLGHGEMKLTDVPSSENNILSRLDNLEKMLSEKENHIKNSTRTKSAATKNLVKISS